MIQIEEPLELEELISSDNIASILEDNDLTTIGQWCKDNYDLDLKSRQGWIDDNEQWMKLATQVFEQKNSPWPGASSVKYPLITLAAIQFHARAYPALVPSRNIVKTIVKGEDSQGIKAERARRIASHMSWQLLEDMSSWEVETDKALLAIPIIGCIFKKTYYDPIRNKNKSETILPRDFVVDYWTRDLEEANRVTHIIEMTDNEIHSHQMTGLFLDLDLSSSTVKPSQLVQGNVTQPQSDTVGIKSILEQHTWIDLDGDGYAEPYIVTLHEETGKVLRIRARYSEERVFVNSDNQVIYIEPINYFTKYSFIPNPDGGFYDIGFGTLLGPLNNSANTIINQLIDAGTLSNTQGGFIGRGLRIREGTLRFRPNEWKVVNASGNDLARSIYPLPVREPSQVLFSLLSFLLNAGQQISSTVDIMVGETPGQNTPATTTMAAIEQGSKIFTAIYKRLRVGLGKEFKKLYYLNSIYLDTEEYFTVLDGDNTNTETIGLADYNTKDHDVIPSADPSVASEVSRMAKARSLLELLNLGTINPLEVTKRLLEVQEQPNIEALLQMPPPPPPPPPDPSIEIDTIKAETDRMRAENEAKFKELELEIKRQANQREFEIKAKEAEIERIRLMMDLDRRNDESALSAAKTLHETAKGTTQLLTEPNKSSNNEQRTKERVVK